MAAAIPTTIEQLQAQLPALQAKMNTASDKYNASVAQRESWRTKALACDAARAQFTLGSKKEKACSMADRGTYYANWTTWENNANADLQAYNIAKGAVDTLNKQIQTAIDQATAALSTDPTFNLQQQQINNQAAQAAAQTAEDAKTKRTWIVVGSIAGGLAAIFGIFKLISHFSKAKTN